MTDTATEPKPAGPCDVGQMLREGAYVGAGVVRDKYMLALDHSVLVVACTVTLQGKPLDWAAYIGAVPGRDHDKEWREVLRHGTKLPQAVAHVLFPCISKEFRWRE